MGDIIVIEALSFDEIKEVQISPSSRQCPLRFARHSREMNQIYRWATTPAIGDLNFERAEVKATHTEAARTH